MGTELFLSGEERFWRRLFPGLWFFWPVRASCVLPGVRCADVRRTWIFWWALVPCWLGQGVCPEFFTGRFPGGWGRRVSATGAVTLKSGQGSSSSPCLGGGWSCVIGCVPVGPCARWRNYCPGWRRWSGRDGSSSCLWARCVPETSYEWPRGSACPWTAWFSRGAPRWMKAGFRASRSPSPRAQGTCSRGELSMERARCGCGWPRLGRRRFCSRCFRLCEKLRLKNLPYKDLLTVWPAVLLLGWSWWLLRPPCAGLF